MTRWVAQMTPTTQRQRDIAGATTNVIHRTAGSNTLGTGKVRVTTRTATPTPMRLAARTNMVRIDLDADPAAALALGDPAEDPRTIFGSVGQSAALAGHPLEHTTEPLCDALVGGHRG